MGPALGRELDGVFARLLKVVAVFDERDAPSARMAAFFSNELRWSLFKAFLGLALECNREEWVLRVRRMGPCPCKQPGRPIARFHSNPSGKCLAGRSAALRRLPIAELLAAHRALHPVPVRYLCDP